MEDWNEVKAKPKVKKASDHAGGDNKPKSYGGKTAGGMLVAGPVKNAQQAQRNIYKHSDNTPINN